MTGTANIEVNAGTGAVGGFGSTKVGVTSSGYVNDGADGNSGVNGTAGKKIFLVI